MTRDTETWSERRERYLHYAADAETASFRCGEGRIRDAYVQIARSWTALAKELGDPANDCAPMESERPQDQQAQRGD
jgi:hypothetical protein